MTEPHECVFYLLFLSLVSNNLILLFIQRMSVERFCVTSLSSFTFLGGV